MQTYTKRPVLGFILNSLSVVMSVVAIAYTTLIMISSAPNTTATSLDALTATTAILFPLGCFLMLAIAKAVASPDINQSWLSVVARHSSLISGILAVFGIVALSFLVTSNMNDWEVWLFCAAEEIALFYLVVVCMHQSIISAAWQADAPERINALLAEVRSLHLIKS